MLEDRYGEPLSTASAAAQEAYVAGVDGVLSAQADYRDRLGEAIAADAGFALAHIALARGLFMDAEVAAARRHSARARELAAATTPREQSHVDAIALAIEGKSPQAWQATLAHLERWPRDALVLAPATSVFGFYGFSGDLEHEEQLYQLLLKLAPAYGSDWWFDGVYAFAACETGRLGEAAQRVERSLAARPRNAHAAHFRAHVLYELGEAAAALAYLEGWMPALPRQSLMHCHLSWHIALAALALGKRERAWAAYGDAVHPGASWGPPINVVTDAASFLWRAEMAGEPRAAALWQQLHRHAQASFPKAGLGFADVHTLLAAIACDDAATIDRLSGEVRQRIADGRYAAGDVVLRLADAMAAYAAGDWNRAIAGLQQALPDTVRIGGSRAQRDLVELTLLAACIKAGRADDATALVARQGDRWKAGALVAGST